MKYTIIITFWLLALTGCQTPVDIKQVQTKNQQLQTELGQARDKITALAAEQVRLQNEISELNRVKTVLNTEKSVRVKQSSELRGQVRRFVQSEIDRLKDFMVQSNLLDYVGGELVQRSHTDDEVLWLVDLANPMPSNGTVTGVSAHFIKPGTFTVQVLRSVDDKRVVIWQSALLKAVQSGVQRVNFPVSVGVERDDVIAYRFNEARVVSFDTGTGDTRYRRKAASLGESVSLNSLRGESQQRAYSVGVYGLLH